VDVRLLAAGAEAFGAGAGAGAAACVLVWTGDEVGMCACVGAADTEPECEPEEDVAAPFAGVCRRAYLVDARLAAELAAGVLAGDSAAPAEGSVVELGCPEPPQPAAVRATTASSARAQGDWGRKVIDMYCSRSFSALRGCWVAIFHT